MEIESTSRNNLLYWVDFPQVVEDRGKLTEFGFHNIPFVPVRTFFINDVPAGTVRGGHAHQWGEQLLVCLSGRVQVLLRQAGQEQSVVCEANNKALLLKAGVWSQQKYLEAGSSLLVFCSHPFTRDSYVVEDDSEQKWKQM